MKFYLFVLCFVSVSAHASVNRWSLGHGFESRVQSGINSEQTENTNLPTFFGQYRREAWSVTLESGLQPERRTQSGGLSITSNTWSLGAWARYEFMQPLRHSPFLSLGYGRYFDNVQSKFGSAVDERSGQRYFYGLGGGMSHAFWNHFLVEAELRALVIQNQQDFALAGSLRAGFVF
ncbi:MAG: hypothetical protein AB7F86_17150 [Bdellovibrionales bacterium]